MVARLGELERAIMERLWACPTGLLASEVAAQLDPRPAPTTVLTVLDRLVRKGLVTRAREGRAHRYTPAGSKESFVAEVMRTTLADTSDPEAVLTHFVGTASETEMAALRRVLDALDRDTGEEPET